MIATNAAITKVKKPSLSGFSLPGAMSDPSAERHLPRQIRDWEFYGRETIPDLTYAIIDELTTIKATDGEMKRRIAEILRADANSRPTPNGNQGGNRGSGGNDKDDGKHQDKNAGGGKSAPKPGTRIN